MYHKTHPQTVEASRRSGRSRGQHGLTQQEWQDREDKRRAIRDYYQAIRLDAEDGQAKGCTTYEPVATSKGKGKMRDRRGKGAAEHPQMPRRVEDMPRREKWLVHNYRSEWLWEAVQQGRAKCHPVQAPRFVFYDAEISDDQLLRYQ